MNEKILAVDDDKSLLETVKKLLEREGYPVTAVDNGYDALKEIKERFFDLIVMDIRMPGMDGLSLLEKVRRIQNGGDKSKVIIMTAYASEDAPIKTIKMGADDYIMKPFEMDYFLLSVNRNIKLSRLEKERKEYISKLEGLHEKDKQLEERLREILSGA